MRTIIFIIALATIAVPAIAGEGDAIVCEPAGDARNCRLCMQDSSNAVTDQCYDCKPGYFLTYSSTTTGTCTRCADGTGIQGGFQSSGESSGSRTSPQQSQASCQPCFDGCATCLSIYTCLRCTYGRWAENFDPVTKTSNCGNGCNPGFTRNIANTDLTAAETYNGVCVSCTDGCQTCKGTGANRCTKCKAGYYVTTFDSASGTGTCSPCAKYATRSPSANPITGTELPGVCSDSCHPTCAFCEGTSQYSCKSCSAFHYATQWNSFEGLGTCSFCPDGKTRTDAGPLLTGVESPSACNKDCHSSCAACKGTESINCIKCPVGIYATQFRSGEKTGSCSSRCDAGTTRDVASTVIAGNEDKAITCVACNVACASCRGTAATGCTKCAAGHYLSARTGTETVGTCTACPDGKGKEADTSEFTSTTATVTKDACNVSCTAASNCGSCSATEPAKCITCSTGFTLDTTTKTCKKSAGQSTNSASLSQVSLGLLMMAFISALC